MDSARLRARWSDDRGATAVEYGLIAALIAVVVTVAVALLGSNLLDSFFSTNDAVEEAVSGQTDTLVTTTVNQQANVQNPDQTPQNPNQAVPVATWQPVGNSGRYRWVCANGYNLGAAGRPIRLTVPSGSAPSCG